MSFDENRFAHYGKSWSERADLAELSAVLVAEGSKRYNLLMHAAHLMGARVALSLSSRKGTLLDFGCGTGRFLRLFGQRGWSVIGTEITPAMLSAAKEFGLPPGSGICLTDGVSIPIHDEAVDMIWVTGVLKYSLFPPGSPCRGGQSDVKTAEATSSFIPFYHEIAAEMYRVLKPGGAVVNLEAWVDAAPETFVADFEQVGFVTKRVHVLRRSSGWFERVFWHDWIPLPSPCIVAAGQVAAALRYCLDSPRRVTRGFCDYLFVWSKKETDFVGRGPKLDRLGAR